MVMPQSLLLRIGLAIVVLVVVAGGCTYYEHTRMQEIVDAEKLNVLRAEAETQIAKANEQLAQDVAKGLRDEVESLHAAASAQPAPSVRCRTSSPTVSTATATSTPVGTSGGVLQTELGHDTGDIGAALYAKADEADIVAAGLRACKAWADGVARGHPDTK